MSEVVAAPADPVEPPIVTAHYLLLAFVGLLIVAAQVLTARPLLPANVPVIVPVHAPAIAARLAREPLSFVYTLPDIGWRALPTAASAIPADREAPRLGYSMRQVLFLGLPMFAYREAGYVAYVDGGRYLTAAGVGDEGLAMLERDTGTRAWSPAWGFWRVCWGWLAPLAVALFAWVQHRITLRRREVMGLI